MKMAKKDMRRICVRLNSEEDRKLDNIKEIHNLNDSDAIRKSINVMSDSEEIVALHRIIGMKLINIIGASNGLEESEAKKIIVNECEDIVCLLAK